MRFHWFLSIDVGRFITRKKFLDDFFLEIIKSCTHAEDERLKKSSPESNDKKVNSRGESSNLLYIEISEWWIIFLDCEINFEICTS